MLFVTPGVSTLRWRYSAAIHRQPNACSGCDAVCGDLLYWHLWRGDHGNFIQYSGAPENAPTAFDGYPMTRQGKMSGCWSSRSLFCDLRGLGPCDDGGNRATRQLGHSQYRTARNFCFGVFWSALRRQQVDVPSERVDVRAAGLIIATIGQDPVGASTVTISPLPILLPIAFVPAIQVFAVSEIFVQAEKKATGKFDAPKKVFHFWRYGRTGSPLSDQSSLDFSVFCRALALRLLLLWAMARLCAGPVTRKRSGRVNLRVRFHPRQPTTQQRGQQ